MNYQRSRIFAFAIDKQHNQLAITFMGSMMRTGALWVRTAGHLQIKGWHNTETGTDQFFFDPCFSLIVVLRARKGIKALIWKSSYAQYRRRCFKPLAPNLPLEGRHFRLRFRKHMLFQKRLSIYDSPKLVKRMHAKDLDRCQDEPSRDYYAATPVIIFIHSFLDVERDLFLLECVVRSVNCTDNRVPCPVSL